MPRTPSWRINVPGRLKEEGSLPQVHQFRVWKGRKSNRVRYYLTEDLLTLLPEEGAARPSYLVVIPGHSVSNFLSVALEGCTLHS